MHKVLVLDDNQDILEAISFILKRKKVNVITLNDPSLLSHYVEEHRPDVVLMDIAMGEYDGRELCREMKNDPGESGIPVILFTAQTYTMSSILESKADAIIEKPFQIHQLYSTLEKFLVD